MTRDCPTCKGAGKIEGVDPATVLFFGVWPGAGGGHYTYDRNGRLPHHKSPLPFDTSVILPILGIRLGDYRRPREAQEQGYARVTHHNGWTVVCCWDRTEDRRGGCNAAFAAPVATTGEAVLEAAAVTFPRKWQQLLEAGGVTIHERE